jgi:hypothetical protein
VHGEGDSRGQLQLIDLLPDIAGDKFNGRLHFGHHPLGFVDAIETALTEMFLLGNAANIRTDLSSRWLLTGVFRRFPANNLPVLLVCVPSGRVVTSVT